MRNKCDKHEQLWLAKIAFHQSKNCKSRKNTKVSDETCLRVGFRKIIKKNTVLFGIKRAGMVHFHVIEVDGVILTSENLSTLFVILLSSSFWTKSNEVLSITIKRVYFTLFILSNGQNLKQSGQNTMVGENWWNLI